MAIKKIVTEKSNGNFGVEKYDSVKKKFIIEAQNKEIIKKNE